MPLHMLDHFNITTDDAEESAKFYVEVLGMRIGDRPPFPFPGAWLYSDDHPVLHLSQRAPEKVPNGKGRFDHIAFQVSGYGDMKASLDKHGAEYIERVVPGEGRGQTQIFVESPDKVMIELVFQPDDVAAG